MTLAHWQWGLGQNLLRAVSEGGSYGAGGEPCCHVGSPQKGLRVGLRDPGSPFTAQRRPELGPSPAQHRGSWAPAWAQPGPQTQAHLCGVEEWPLGFRLSQADRTWLSVGDIRKLWGPGCVCHPQMEAEMSCFLGTLVKRGNVLS